MDVAYETWGELNEERDNAVIISAGLSAASHAKSHPVRLLVTYSKQPILLFLPRVNTGVIFFRNHDRLPTHLDSVWDILLPLA